MLLFSRILPFFPHVPFPPACCCVLGAEPTTGSTKSSGVKMLKKSLLETLPSQKNLPPNPSRKFRFLMGREHLSTQVDLLGIKLLCCRCSWEVQRDEAGQYFGGKETLCCFWAERYFTLQSIAGKSDLAVLLADGLEKRWAE